jgi:hypothetical protein
MRRGVTDAFVLSFASLNCFTTPSEYFTDGAHTIWLAPLYEVFREGSRIRAVAERRFSALFTYPGPPRTELGLIPVGYMALTHGATWMYCNCKDIRLFLSTITVVIIGAHLFG